MSNLDSLRLLLQKHDITALIVPHRDAHLSEYPPIREYRVRFLSNFSGSNATLIVTQDDAFFFTDSRYYIQAGQELPQNWTLIKRSSPWIGSLNLFLLVPRSVFTKS
ncbi:hypothetical protein GEMRC1_008413 [Eukaryota sp. GEM-RC1]